MAGSTPPCFDDVHLWTFTRSPTDEKARLAHRVALRRAHRFRIDANLVKHVRDMAADPGSFNRFHEWIMLARLPYDDVWLEFDVVEDGSEFQLGYLLRRDPKSSTRWVCHSFMTKVGEVAPLGREKVTPHLLSFVVDTEGEAKSPACQSFVPPLSDQFPRLLSKKAERNAWALSDGHDLRPDREWIRIKDPWYLKNVYVTAAPSRTYVFKNIQGDEITEFHETLKGMLTYTLRSMRSVILTLAIMNDMPVVMTEVASRQGHMTQRLHRVPYLSHTVIGLKIPAKRPVEWLQRRLDHSVIRRKGHSVRGHWRKYLDKSTGELRFRVWIGPYDRGDASLGWVTHDYFVEEPGAEPVTGKSLKDFVQPPDPDGSSGGGTDRPV